jgi:hypothetical protein
MSFSSDIACAQRLVQGLVRGVIDKEYMDRSTKEVQQIVFYDMRKMASVKR